MLTVLVSACLLGTDCKYNGGNNYNPDVVKLKEKYKIIPVCPEKFGGLTAPREPAEIKEGNVYLKDGTDVTEQFLNGAAKALVTARVNGCKYAVLKSRSPSCGYGKIYDGTFCGKLTKGNGIAADMLDKNGICIFNEENFKEVLL